MDTQSERVEFSAEVGDAVCEYLMSGKSLSSLRRNRADGLPGVTAIMKWVAEGDAYAANGQPTHPKAIFAEQYARAFPIRADVLFEECLDIADDNETDSYVDEEGKTITNLDHIQRMKLRVDTRKWMVGKMAPKKYGEKSEVEHKGEVGFVVELKDYSKPKQVSNE